MSKFNSQDYDSVAGISSYLDKGLAGFHRLVQRRHDAYYRRKENLHEWVILGRWYFDTCGNVMTASKEFIPAEKFNEPSVTLKMPCGAFLPVLSNEWFWAYMKMYDRIILPNVLTQTELDDMHSMKWDDPNRNKYKGRPYPTSITWEGRFDAPTQLCRCPVCGKGWTLENCHDVYQTRKMEVIPISKYAGMTLAQWKRRVFRHKARKQGVVSCIAYDGFLRNDKYIDHRPNPKYPEVEINKDGWVGRVNGQPTIDKNSHIIELGDEIDTCTWTHYHKACWRKHQGIEEEKYFRDIFKKAGFEDFLLLPIPNEYCPCEHCAPWYEVKFILPAGWVGLSKRFVGGIIKIGWRKRVINIDVTHAHGKGFAWHPSLATLFSDQDVTKGDTYIHAHGTEKCIEYLTKIRQEIVK
jgi:hypothetical protein